MERNNDYEAPRVQINDIELRIDVHLFLLPVEVKQNDLGTEHIQHFMFKPDVRVLQRMAKILRLYLQKDMPLSFRPQVILPYQGLVLCPFLILCDCIFPRSHAILYFCKIAAISSFE